MKKDIQTLEKIEKLLNEVFKSIDVDIENNNDIFNNHQALEVIKKYPSITTSLDDLLFELKTYFEELIFIHKEK